MSRLTDWVDRLLWRWRCPTIHAEDPGGGRSGDEVFLSLGTGRWWRYGLDIRLTAEDADLLAEQMAEDAAEARAWRIRTGRAPTPEHAGGDAEDCPICRPLIDQPGGVLYPWLCTGPDTEEAR